MHFVCLAACFFVFAGIYKFGVGLWYIVLTASTKGEWLNPGVDIVEGLDSFMLALLFVIFAYGIYRIFILDDQDDSKFPMWLHVHSFSELKLLLWETTIVTLIVFSVTLLTQTEKPTTDQLIKILV